MAKRRIHSKSLYWRHEEHVAVGVLSPGMLLMVDSASKVKVHATEGGRAERLIAMEDALQGKNVNEAYAIGDIVTCALPLPGDEFNMMIASGENISIGDELISGGDGTLINRTNAASPSKVVQTIAYAMEAQAAPAANTLSAVRIK